MMAIVKLSFDILSFYRDLAQLAEQPAHNRSVTGSRPVIPTIII